jgi:hypothetical protein
LATTRSIRGPEGVVQLGVLERGVVGHGLAIGPGRRLGLAAREQDAGAQQRGGGLAIGAPCLCAVELPHA